MKITDYVIILYAEGPKDEEDQSSIGDIINLRDDMNGDVIGKIRVVQSDKYSVTGQITELKRLPIFLN
jgi:hypothetical protein